MKHPESYYLNDLMRQDLFDTYRKVYGECFTQASAWERTAKHEAKRFYVSGKQCLQRLSPILIHGQKGFRLKNKRREKMYTDLLEIVRRLMNMPEHNGKSLFSLCKMAVLQPAPEFYLSPSDVRIRINEAKAEQLANLSKHIKKNGTEC